MMHLHSNHFYLLFRISSSTNTSGIICDFCFQQMFLILVCMILFLKNNSKL